MPLMPSKHILQMTLKRDKTTTLGHYVARCSYLINYNYSLIHERSGVK